VGNNFSGLWRWDGEIDRGPYAVIGVVGFAIKHNLDRIVGGVFFNHPWGLSPAGTRRRR
jgi:hypothetical protein